MPRPEGMSPIRMYSISQLTNGQAINERIKELEYKDAKVRVTNVDSQGSDANIVIQVIGEISNQGQPHKRFVQTFVLAEQTNGYFVLNDIFRYLAEEDEEAQQDAVNGTQEPSPTAAVPENESSSEAAAPSEEDLSKVDDKLVEAAQEEPAADVTAAAPAEEVTEETEQPQTEEAPAAATEEASSKAPEAPAEEASEVEKPAAPKSTPAPAASKAASVAMPTGPPKPKTWASLAASAHKVATPVVNAPASQQAQSQPKAAAPAQAAAAAPAQTSASARDQSPANSQGEATGWQSVTGHKKEQSRAQNQGPAADPDQKRAYIKNVFSQVEEVALKTLLTKYGEVEYMDISRPKVCTSRVVSQLQL